MQAALPSTYDFLKLADPVALFDSVDIGLDGAAIRRAIDMAIKRIPEDAEQPRARRRKRVLAEAGRILLSDPERRAEVIHLSYVAAPDLADTTPLASLRLRALWGGGDRKGLIVEADRLMQLGTHKPADRQALSKIFRKWGIEGSLSLHIAQLRDYWPNPEASASDPLANIASDGIFPLIARLGPMIAGLNGCAPENEGDFLTRVRQGAELHRGMYFLNRIAPAILKKPARSQTPDEKTALAIRQALKKRISPPDLAPIKDCIASGRSAVLTQAHVGLSTKYDMTRDLPSISHSLVSKSASPAKRQEDFNLAAYGPDVAIGFAKLAKLMRKSPRLVRIFPDGAIGDLMEISIFGHPVKIGRGAVVLAYLGKAQTYFSRSIRTKEGFIFTLQPGPDAMLYTDRDAFEDDFAKFYAGCCEEVILGAPEDMTLKSGFWPKMK